MNKIIALVTASFLFNAPFSSNALADTDLRPVESKNQTADEAPESAATFDNRLPPVIPGEEVKDGNKKITAEILGISRRSLYNKLAEYGIDAKRRVV